MEAAGLCRDPRWHWIRKQNPAGPEVTAGFLFFPARTTKLTPLGSALIGSAPGDAVSFTAPTGAELQVEVVSVD